MTRFPAVLSLMLTIGTALMANAAEGGRSIVILRDGADADGLARRHGVAADHVFSHTVHGFAAHLGAGVAAALAADPDVRYVVADRLLSLPKPVVEQGKSGGSTPAPSPSQRIPSGISRIGAPDSPAAGIDGVPDLMDVDIAIIDTGIDLKHPDLNVSNARQANIIRPSALAQDDNGHGTHCAGIAAAIDNTIGVVGVAPGARLWAVKVLDRRGSGWVSDIVKGIDWAADPARGIEVISLSLGGAATSGPDPLHDAIVRAVNLGIVVTVAAGNESADAATSSPANTPEAITVSAIADSDGHGGGLGGATGYGPDDSFASFSNFGTLVDIAAPGVSILSTYPGGYATMSGTSMACPHVAGAAALVIARTRPAGTGATFVANVRAALLTAAVPQTSADGFTGAPASSTEPLLNIGKIGAPAPVAN